MKLEPPARRSTLDQLAHNEGTMKKAPITRGLFFAIGRNIPLDVTQHGLSDIL